MVAGACTTRCMVCDEKCGSVEWDRAQRTCSCHFFFVIFDSRKKKVCDEKIKFGWRSRFSEMQQEPWGCPAKKVDFHYENPVVVQEKCGCLPKRPNPRSQLYLLPGSSRNGSGHGEFSSYLSITFSMTVPPRWRSRYTGQQPDLTTVLRPYMEGPRVGFFMIFLENGLDLYLFGFTFFWKKDLSIFFLFSLFF